MQRNVQDSLRLQAKFRSPLMLPSAFSCLSIDRCSRKIKRMEKFKLLKSRFIHVKHFATFVGSEYREYRET